jgi:hypothetical protein
MGVLVSGGCGDVLELDLLFNVMKLLYSVTAAMAK